MTETSDGAVLLVDGDVSGSGNDDYETMLKLNMKPSGITATSECTCPVTHNCKHGIALLFYFMENITSEAEVLSAAAPVADITPELDQWLKTIEADSVRDPIAEQQAEVAAAQYHLLYLLDLKEESYHQPEKKLTEFRVYKNMFVAIVEDRLWLYRLKPTFFKML